MRFAAFLFLLAAKACLAQNALWLDFSGQWRMSTDDNPAYAQSAYDDQRWEAVQLPWTSQPKHGLYWVRRSVTLPDGTDTSRLALTLGTIGEAYEVYVNGVQIGKAAGFSNEEAQIARPLTFPIPQQAVGAAGTLVIAVRVWKLQTLGHYNWIIFNEGPYVISYTFNAPQDLGPLIIKQRQLRLMMTFALGLVLALFALTLLAFWLSERQRSVLIWFALCLAFEAASSMTAVLLISPDASPWSWSLRNRLFAPLRAVMFAEFVMAALRIYRWPLRAVFWALFGVTLLVAENFEIKELPLNATDFLIAILIAVGWRRVATSDRSLTQFVNAALLSALVIANLSRFGLGRFIGGPTIAVGPFDIITALLVETVLSLFMTGLLIYELMRDRQEKVRLTGELEAARVVQQLLLPQASAANNIYISDAVYEPAQEVGGDFYWTRINADGSMFVVVGDVSGKGLKAAMLVSVAVGILRNEKSHAPGAVLAALNDGLAGNTDGGFVTCCCALFDLDGTVTLANAGHLAPYCDGVELEIEAGLPLGIVGGVEYGETTVRGTDFTFVSDGVVEAENVAQELFGFDRTRQISGKSAREIAEAAKAWGQNDDITVVTVRRLS